MKLTHDNTILQLSDYALMDGNKVKVLTCNCSLEVTRTGKKCTSCKCAKRGVECVPGMCKCEMMCWEDVGDIMGREYMDVTTDYADAGEAA